MYQNRGAKIYIECLVAASKIWTLHLIYQLNFTYPPCRAFYSGGISKIVDLSVVYNA